MNLRIKQLLTTVMLCHCSLLPRAVYAEAADWYRWESVKTGRSICRQVDPGVGWTRHSGPYLDAGCRQLRQPPSKQLIIINQPILPEKP